MQSGLFRGPRMRFDIGFSLIRLNDASSASFFALSSLPLLFCIHAARRVRLNTRANFPDRPAKSNGCTAPRTPLPDYLPRAGISEGLATISVVADNSSTLGGRWRKKKSRKRKERKKGATEGNLRQGGINERRDRDALGDVVSLRVRPRALTRSRVAGLI